MILGEKSGVLRSAWGLKEGPATKPTFCAWYEEENVVEIGFVILSDRGSAVSWGTEGNTIPLLCNERLDRNHELQFTRTFQTVKE